MPTAVKVNADVLNKHALEYASKHDEEALKKVRVCPTVLKHAGEAPFEGLAVSLSDESARVTQSGA